MAVHSFHLARPGFFRTMAALLNPPSRTSTVGLRHAECMFPMTLGAAILSPGRWQVRSMAMFAEWEHEEALDAFLTESPLGRALSKGWHVRLRFLRRWGHVAAVDGLPERDGETAPDAPVVAVTLARLSLPQVPRFLHWGKPVERFVRDHPGATLAMAATRPMRTISTFTIWRSAREMAEMVHGRDEEGGLNRHAAAMVEHRRKDFHLEFTTLRFACLSEHGAWNGRTSFVPELPGAAEPIEARRRTASGL